MSGGGVFTCTIEKDLYGSIILEGIVLSVNRQVLLAVLTVCTGFNCVFELGVVLICCWILLMIVSLQLLLHCQTAFESREIKDSINILLNINL